MASAHKPDEIIMRAQEEGPNREREAASSGAIADELVYVLNDNLTRPYLSAYGKGSGIEVWTVERQAPEGFFPSGWSTPYV